MAGPAPLSTTCARCPATRMSRPGTPAGSVSPLAVSSSAIHRAAVRYRTDRTSTRRTRPAPRPIIQPRSLIQRIPSEAGDPFDRQRVSAEPREDLLREESHRTHHECVIDAAHAHPEEEALDAGVAQSRNLLDAARRVVE